jgi:hypothetical protein
MKNVDFHCFDYLSCGVNVVFVAELRIYVYCHENSICPCDLVNIAISRVAEPENLKTVPAPVPVPTFYLNTVPVPAPVPVPVPAPVPGHIHTCTFTNT